ncbi:MAG: O-antigen ligase family protein [Bryobacteraceae bacterium]
MRILKDDKLPAALFAVLSLAVLTAWIDTPWAGFPIYALVFAIGLAACLDCPRRPRRLYLHPVAIVPFVAAGLGFWQIVSGATLNRWETLNASLFWSADGVVFLVAAQFFFDPARRERFLGWLIWFGAAVSVEAVLQLYSSRDRVFWHFPIRDPQIAMGPFLYHNHFAAFAALLLPVALARAVTGARRWLAPALMAATLGGAVMASASRSGALVVAVEVVLGLALGMVRIGGAFKRRLRRPLLVLALFAAFAAIAGWDTLWLRLHWGDSARLRYARASLAMIHAAPWHGVGLGCWPSAYPMYATVDDGFVANQAHSDWLQWASEGGLPLTALMISFAVALSLRALRSPWALGIPAVFALALADYPFEKPAVALLLFTLAGALVPDRLKLICSIPD